MNNYADIWQIDHIIPLNVLQTQSVNDINLSDENIECVYKWYNTRPLSCIQNMKKNKYLSRDDLLAHQASIKAFRKTHSNLFDETYYNYKKIITKLLDNM